MLKKEQIEMIQDYMLKEFENNYEYRDEKEIALAYTEAESQDGNKIVPVEVTLSLELLSLITEVGEKVFEEIKYDNEKELNNLLINLSFDDLVSEGLYEAEKLVGNIEE